MKRILMVLAVLTLCFSMVACGKDKTLNNDKDNVNTEISGEITPDVSGEDIDEELPGEIESGDEETSGDISSGDEEVPGDEVEDSEENPEENPDEDEWVDPNATSLAMKTLVDTLNTKANVLVRAPFDMQITEDSALTDIGLTADQFNSSVADSVKSESMVSPSNHSLCIVKVKDGVNAAELKKTIYDNCKPNKWVCMSAEYVLAVDNGEYVMLVMSTKENCDNLYNAFVAEFSNAGEKLEKEVVEDFGGEDWDIL